MFFKICSIYAKFLHILVFIAGCTLIFSVGLQVAGRYVPFIPPYLWTLEVTNFAMIWAIFIGSILGVRNEKHFVVEIFGLGGKPIHPGLNRFLRLLYYACALSFTWVFIYYGGQYFYHWGLIQTSDITGVNLGWLYVAVPCAGASWLLFLLENFLIEFVKGAGQAGLAAKE